MVVNLYVAIPKSGNVTGRAVVFLYAHMVLGAPDIADLPAGDQARPLCALDLAEHRRVRGTGPPGDLGQAQLQARVGQQQRQDLALLPRPQHRQQRVQVIARRG
jgi:hypothetical protein